MKEIHFAHNNVFVGTMSDIPRNFKDLIEGSELIKNKVFESFNLIDVNEIEDKDLREQSWFGIVAYFMKHIRSRQLIKLRQFGLG